MPDNTEKYTINYPPREKAIMNPKNIETPEKPKKKVKTRRPKEVPKEHWDTLNEAQKLQSIATYKALNNHAVKHGGK